MLPPESWVMAWMAGLAGAALLVVGVKLESIINQVWREFLPCSPLQNCIFLRLYL